MLKTVGPNRLLHGVVTASLLFHTSACAKYARPIEPAPWSERVLHEAHHEEQVRGRRSKKIDVERNGNRLSVRVRQLCTITRLQSIERTGTIEYENDKVGSTVVAFAVGAGAIAGAVALGLHAAPQLVSNDEKENSKGGSNIVGVGLLGLLGVGGLTVGSLKAFSALRSEEKTETITRKTTLAARPCKEAKLRPVKVKLEPERRMNPRYVYAGSTDKDGELSVKLSEVVPVRWLSGSKPTRRARVMVDGRKAATIEIASLSEDITEKIWAKLEPAISRCKKSTRRRGCHAMQRFIKTHPNSPRVADAQQLLKEHRARQHDHAWAEAKIKTCAKPQKSSDCRGVKRYLRRYPKGKHAPKARRVVTKVDKKLTRLGRIEDVRTAQQERAEERRETARERREAAQRKHECLKDCRAEFQSCNRSCRGLSSAAACRRNCRSNFVSCELGCAREERGSSRSRSRSRGKSRITVRIGGNKPRSAVRRVTTNDLYRFHPE